ncbi:MAG: cation:proton antiporter [Alphaproteobacteria bacterium]|jgi:CPA2 family monovalent cation:H+ antiporter-2|nr:cation:proton antiporter [Alphaproteobacteria bacterium]
MLQETALIATLVIGLVMAFGLGLVALRLRLSPLVGYLLAGMAVGPFTTELIGDDSLAIQLGDIGLVLLMFGVGLTFSLRDLIAVRTVALSGAIVQMAITTLLGALLAVAWDWRWAEALVFGLALSVASTVVMRRALEERRELDGSDGRIAVGWLVAEDVVIVLVLLLLPAVTDATATGSEIGISLGLALVKAAVFFAVALLIGRRLAPWALAQAARTGSRELYTLAVLVLGLGLAFGAAYLFGVTVALGAFLAGVAFGESELSRRAANDTLPLKHAIAVPFFISLGLMFDFHAVAASPLAVMGVLIVVVVAKAAVAAGIMLAFRRPLRTALTVSASLAQIGEFSFILAGLGGMLGLLSDEARDLIIAGAVLSIVINPLMFAAVRPLSRWLGRKAWVARLAPVEADERDDKAAGRAAPQGHVVLVGYGRIGRLVASGLKDRGRQVVVIEQDPTIVERLAAEGEPVIYGNAAAAAVIEAAWLRQARLVVVTLSDPLQAGEIAALAHAANPDLQVIARAAGEVERSHLAARGADRVVVDDRELGLAMTLESLLADGLDEPAAVDAVKDIRRGLLAGQ